MKLRYAIIRQEHEIARFNERQPAIEYVLWKREGGALEWSVFDMADGKYGKKIY